MWVRRSALRPVPRYARVSPNALDKVRDRLTDDEGDGVDLDQAFDRFEGSQPALANYLSDILGGPLDETAVTLGYFLGLAVWMAFEVSHGDALESVSADLIEATAESLNVDRTLRAGDPSEALESDDIIAIDQPELVAFVHEHIDATLETHAESIDVGDIDRVYSLILVQLLALSYSVKMPRGFPTERGELLA